MHPLAQNHAYNVLRTLHNTDSVMSQVKANKYGAKLGQRTEATVCGIKNSFHVTAKSCSYEHPLLEYRCTKPPMPAVTTVTMAPTTREIAPNADTTIILKYASSPFGPWRVDTVPNKQAIETENRPIIELGEVHKKRKKQRMEATAQDNTEIRYYVSSSQLMLVFP